MYRKSWLAFSAGMAVCVLFLSGCQWTASRTEAEALLGEVAAKVDKEEPMLKGHTVISMNDQVIYRQEDVWYTSGPETSARDAGAESQPAVKVPFMIEWDELEEAAEEVELMPSREGVAVLRVTLGSKAAEEMVIRYLEENLDQVRVTVSNMDGTETAKQAAALLRDEEERMRDTLSTLSAFAEYRLHVDTETREVRQLDASVKLRYNKEGSTVEETVTGSFRAVLP